MEHKRCPNYSFANYKVPICQHQDQTAHWRAGLKQEGACIHVQGKGTRLRALTPSTLASRASCSNPLADQQDTSI